MVAHRALNPEIFVQFKFPHPKLTLGGTTKKYNYKQIIKVMSSFAVIAMVLVAGLTVPVNAAVHDVYYPADWISDVISDGSDVTIRYEFTNRTYISALNRNTNGTTNGYEEIYLWDFTSDYIFRIFPLGRLFTPGSNCTSELIDISDFKKQAVVDLSYNMIFRVYCNTRAGADGTSELTFITYSYICYFDSDGKFLSYDYNTLQQDVIQLENRDPDGDVYVYNPGTMSLSTRIPDDAVYMAPCYLMYAYPPDGHSPIFITELDACCGGFRLDVKKNLLIEQSETLKAIEEQLGDLNDKTDTIINGTQEQQEAGQNALDKAEEQEREFDEIMDQLEEYEKIDSGSVSSEIQNFVYTDGWLYVKDLLSPLLDWGPTATIMLIVLALVNISVILFGR